MINKLKSLEEYVCTKCKTPLKIETNDSICNNCNKKYNVRNEVINFSDESFYWNQLKSEEMDKLILDTKNVGWRKAISNHPKISESLEDYISNESRGDWHLYVPLNKKSKVLDLGCGWGSAAIQISKWCGILYAADSTLETLYFVKERAIQENIRNISLLGINPLDYPNFPFKENYFDLVILNGVLEWVGSSNLSKNPLELQKEALKSLFNHTKKGGYIYIGIENRYAPNHFTGGPVHGELPFASVLPRRVSEIYTNLVRGESHRTYIHSAKVYRELLIESGFKKINFLWPRPNYRTPNYIIPLENLNVLRYWSENIISNETLRQKFFKTILSKFFPYHYSAPSFGILAKKI